MQRLAAHDPGNAHAVDYTWGITGIAYNEAQIRRACRRRRVDSWSLMFDPKVAAAFRRLRHRTVRVAQRHRAQRAGLAGRAARQ